LTHITPTDLASIVRYLPPRLGDVRLICIDGPAASGKTTLAQALAHELAQPPILHMDDLCEGWSGQGQVWERVEQLVLNPLREGRPARYQRYDWDADRWAESHTVPNTHFLLLEGVGSAPRSVDGFASYIVWVEASDETRMQRGLSRDGEHMRSRWEQWTANEHRDFEAEQTRQRANLRLLTADGLHRWQVLE
jgi:uridine kinase